MYLGAVSAVDDVTIGNYAIHADEKTAAPGKLFAASIEGFNRHRGRFDPANQFGKGILSKGWWRQDDVQRRRCAEMGVRGRCAIPA